MCVAAHKMLCLVMAAGSFKAFTYVSIISPSICVSSSSDTSWSWTSVGALSYISKAAAESTYVASVYLCLVVQLCLFAKT